MKRNCNDITCNKRFVTSKHEQQLKRVIAPVKGDENLCEACFRDVVQISHEQSYFGSIGEWGACDSSF